MRKMLLFDIDGTLLYTGGAGRAAFERAFEELFGIPDAWGDTNPDGKTDPWIIDEIAGRILDRSLQAEEYGELVRRYLLYFRSEIKNSPRFRLMPGVPALLRALSTSEEFLVGVATGNFEDSAWSKLEQGGIREYFGFGGFASDSGDRPEILRAAIERGRRLHNVDLRPEEIFVIGDTERDVQAAKAIGARAIAVATGRMTREDFASHEPHHVLADLADTDGFFRVVRCAIM
jgi:phosphoglycolate phosphatase-like HAD superfamily hydrolase